MSKIRWSCVAVMLLAATTPTFAQEAEAPEPSTEAAAEDSTAVDSPDAADEPSIPTYLDEVTVAATGTERSLGETPGKVDVIQAEEIERRGLNGFDDLVRYLPGVELDGDLGRFGTSGFRIRGIGGNRVLTRVDGVPNAEQFDFGPFTVTQLALDVDALESVEVVRSAGSALYGSDALGGVVDLTTRDPRSYLNGESRALALRGGYDGRSDELSEAIVFALGSDAWRASVLYSRRDGDELDNQGTNGAENSSRTEPNPIDRSSNQVLAKLGYSQSETSDFVVSAEWFDSDAETEVFSSRSSGSPFASAILDSDGTDTQERWRLSLEQTWVRETVAFDSLLARLYVQDAETEQVTLERRLPFQGESIRDGLLSFDQQTFGLDLDFYRSLGRGDELGVLTYGVDWQEDSFDQLRDRTEFVIATGEPVPTTLALPTKYFPESDIEELGLFVQAQLALFDGRLEVVPGVRYDEYSLDADQNDAIFLSGNPGSPPPVDLDTDSVSPKLGVVFQATDTFSVFGQYARGFRAPPMSAVNNGFTNFGGGYRTLASPDLEPETSDNLEFGVRGNFSRFDFSVTYFDNEYEDFIETVFLGFNPIVGLVEFQPQNVEEVEISGFEVEIDARLADAWRLRAAYTDIEGDDLVANEPLESIAPSELVAGLQFAPPGSRWGAELLATLVDSKDASDLQTDSSQFQAPSYELIDLVAWFQVTDRLQVQASAWNLTDETYWRWSYVRGQSASSSTIDRFTSPGRSVGAQLRFRF